MMKTYDEIRVELVRIYEERLKLFHEHPNYSKDLPENMFLHGVIHGLDWVLNETIEEQIERSDRIKEDKIIQEAISIQEKRKNAKSI